MRLSIIIPVYCTKQFDPRSELESTLKKLEEQKKNRDIELILIENGCLVDMGFLWEWCEGKEWVKHKVYGAALGISTARNRGLELATGEYITFIDCDDDIVSDYLDIQFSNLDNYYGYISYDWRFSDGKPSQMYTPGYRNNAVWAYTFHRAIIGKKRFDESLKFCEDIDFVKRVLQSDIPHYDDPHVIYIYKWQGNPNSYAHRFLRGEIE